MKRKTYIFPVIAVLLLSLIFMVACDNDSGSGNDEPSDADRLVGTWSANLITAYLNLTTNSNQNAQDLFSQGLTPISISGTVETQLDYLYTMNMNGVEFVMATNQSFLEMGEGLLKPEDYPIYTLNINDDGETQAAFFSEELSEENNTSYWGDYANFSYNLSTKSLTANNATLYNFDNGDTVNANGVLQAQTIAVPANTPTDVLTLPILTSLFGSAVMTLNDDNSFMAVLTMDGESDTLTGQWELLPEDRIQITPDLDAADVDIDEEIVLTAGYTINGDNNVTFTVEESLDDYVYLLEDMGEFDEAQVYALAEALFGLEAGSLTNITLRATLTVNRQVSKAPVMSGHGRLFNPHFIEFMIKAMKAAE